MPESAETAGVIWSRGMAVSFGIGVVLLAAMLLLWGLWSLPLSDPDAGMYADIGAHMAASGDWITPRLVYGISKNLRCCTGQSP